MLGRYLRKLKIAKKYKYNKKLIIWISFRVNTCLITNKIIYVLRVEFNTHCCIIILMILVKITLNLKFIKY